MSVAVIGGGIAGLAAARRLRATGAEVTVFEAGDRPGGKIAAGRLAGLDLDIGAESMLARAPAGERSPVVDLLESLGLTAVSPAPNRSGLLIDGTVRPLPRSMFGVPFDVGDLTDVLSADGLERARHPRVGSAPLDADVAIGALVEQQLGAEVVDRMVEPMLGGIYAGHARRLSLAAVAPALWERARAGGSLVEHAAALSAPRPESSSVDADRPRPASPLVGVAGGVTTVVAALAERLRSDGVDLRTGATVRELTRVDGGWQLTIGPTTHPERRRFDAVVSAVPAPALARLLGGLVSPSVVGALSGIEYASVAVIAVAVRGLDVDGSGLLVPPGGLPTIKAFTHATRKWPWLRERADDAIGDDADIVRISIGRAGAATTLQLPDEQLMARTLAEAAGVPGWEGAEVIDARLRRWGGALPQYAVGHRDLVARVRDELAGLGGIAAAGALWDGVGIAACLRSADHAVAALGAAGGTSQDMGE